MATMRETAKIIETRRKDVFDRRWHHKYPVGMYYWIVMKDDTMRAGHVNKRTHPAIEHSYTWKVGGEFVERSSGARRVWRFDKRSLFIAHLLSLPEDQRLGIVPEDVPEETRNTPDRSTFSWFHRDTMYTAYPDTVSEYGPNFLLCDQHGAQKVVPFPKILLDYCTPRNIHIVARGLLDAYDIDVVVGLCKKI